MFKFIKTLFGIGLPSSGKVVSKPAPDNIRSVDYGGVAGVQSINKEPVYYLGIQDGDKEPRFVPVTREEWKAAKEGEQWSKA